MQTLMLFLPIVACMVIITSHLMVIVILRRSRHTPELFLDGSVVTAYTIFCCYYVEHVFVVS